VYLIASTVESNALTTKTIRWIFISMHYFRNHVKSHKLDQFICEWCKKKFRVEKNLRFRNIKSHIFSDHIAKKHAGDQIIEAEPTAHFKCFDCKQTFSDLKAYMLAGQN